MCLFFKWMVRLNNEFNSFVFSWSFYSCEVLNMLMNVTSAVYIELMSALFVLYVCLARLYFMSLELLNEYLCNDVKNGCVYKYKV